MLQSFFISSFIAASNSSALAFDHSVNFSFGIPVRSLSSVNNADESTLNVGSGVKNTDSDHEYSTTHSVITLHNSSTDVTVNPTFLGYVRTSLYRKDCLIPYECKPYICAE